jgi:signal transduction histidine kinase
MRLALRFAVAITIGIGAILVVQAVMHVQRIGELQEAEIKDVVITLGRALANAVGEVWELGGPDRASQFVASADQRRERTKLTFRSADSVDDPALLARDTHVQRLSTIQGWSIVAVAPVRANGRTVGLLEIERELPSEQERFASILQTQVATTIAAAGISGLIALAVGVWVVVRPIRKLSRLARRVAEGDYSLRSNVVQADEIGELAREFDSMVQRLDESRAQIHAERRARTETLEKLRHADRLSTVGRLASSIAHELGTPLNIVSGRAAMISSDETVDQEARENARLISEQIERMTLIIRSTLEFSRRKPIDKRETPMGELLDHAVVLLEPILEENRIVVRIDGPVDLVAAIDSDKILQVLTNLMMNAIHAMPDGGRITLEMAREYVTDPKDRHATEGDFVKISVEDEGIGIAEDRLTDIFDAFATSKGQGTGLGLSVCQGIVREHDGWIEVESELGRGSRFTIYLPESEDA